MTREPGVGSREPGISAAEKSALLWQAFCERARSKGLERDHLTPSPSPAWRGESGPIQEEALDARTPNPNKYNVNYTPAQKPLSTQERGWGEAPEPPDLGDLYQQMLAIDARRAGGVYYTPAKVADSIAATTLEPLTAEAVKTPDPVTALLALRVADLACGSGRMLSAAVRYIARALAQVDPQKRGAEEWGLCALNCVHGCDIDPLALEAARYSLWLEFAPAGCAKLPDIDLVQANGLVALPAGWGPFDAVLGNPPYVASKAIAPEQRAALREQYETARGQFDLCVPFVEAGLRALREGGVLGYILSNKFMAADYGAALRQMLLEQNTLLELRDVSADKLFSGAQIYPAIIVVQKALPTPDHSVRCNGPGSASMTTVPQARFMAHPQRLISLSAGSELAAIVDTMQQAARPLADKLIKCGVASSGFAKRLHSRDAMLAAETEQYKPLLGAQNVGAYALHDTQQARLLYRGDASVKRWRDFSRPKLLIPGISMRLQAAFDQHGFALGRVYYIDAAAAGVDPFALLALLNSETLDLYYRYYYWPAHLSGGFLRINSTYLATLPLLFAPSPTIDQLGHDCAELIGALQRGETTPTQIRQQLEPLVRNLYGLTGE